MTRNKKKALVAGSTTRTVIAALSGALLFKHVPPEVAAGLGSLVVDIFGPLADTVVQVATDAVAQVAAGISGFAGTWLWSVSQKGVFQSDERRGY